MSIDNPRASLPPLEPEREPLLARPGFRLGAIGVVILAATVTGLVLGLSGRGHPRAKSATSDAPGRLLAYDNNTGHLVFENPDGTDRIVVRHVLSGPPLLSPDGRYVLTGSGNELFRLGADTGTLFALKSPVSSVNGLRLTPSQPFVDHDRLLLAPRPFSARASVVLVPLQGGRRAQVGAADDAAGDPVSRAVYVTVAAGSAVPSPSDPQLELQPDGRVEVRDPGHRARVIVTAARLGQLARLPSGVKMLISVYPSPDGTRLLVDGRSLDADHPGAVLAVFDTSGYRLLDHVAGSKISGGYWSHNGDRLAVFDGPTGLVLWQPGSGVTPLALPGSATTPWAGCVWSAADNWLACSGGTAGAPQPTKRLLVDLKTGRARTLTSSDEPLEWLR